MFAEFLSVDRHDHPNLATQYELRGYHRRQTDVYPSHPTSGRSEAVIALQKHRELFRRYPSLSQYGPKRATSKFFLERHDGNSIIVVTQLDVPPT